MSILANVSFIEAPGDECTSGVLVSNNKALRTEKVNPNQEAAMTNETKILRAIAHPFMSRGQYEASEILPFWSPALRRFFLSVAILITMHILSADTRSQIRIGAITPTSGHEVKVFRNADIFKIDAAVDMELQPYDEIECFSGKAIVELKSGPENTLIASGQFRIAVRPPDGRAFSLFILMGDADMQARYPSLMCTPEACMGPLRTEYSIRARRTEQGISREYTVFDGEVKVGSAGPERMISAGEKLVTKATEPSQQQKLQFEDFNRPAILYANTDLTKAIASGAEVDRSALFDNLRRLHTEVLIDPRNSTKRVNLALAQVVNGSSSSAVYQLTKAEEYSTGGDTKQLLTIATLKGAALSEIGRDQEAQEQFRKALQIDPAALQESTLKNYKLKPKTIELIKQHNSVVAGPREQQDLLMKLIDEKRYPEAIDGFSKRVRMANANSRDYYGLAVAYSNSGDSVSSAKYANNAIQFSLRDRALSTSELDTANRLAKQPR